MLHPKTILSAYGISPRKGLGQNFLNDENVLDRIITAADIDSKMTVVEVGPGLGHLTERLACRAGRVIAVELDDRLLPILRAHLAPFSNVQLLQADVLEGSWYVHVQDDAYCVVANVPYYITGAILRHFLESEVPPQRLVITIQKEVAERLTAAPGELSLLAISVLFFGTVNLVDVIKAGSFWPRPDVDSAVVRIDVHGAEKWGVTRDTFFQVVRAGFGQKRKQLQKNLRVLGLDRRTIDSALADAGIERARRAQTLAIEEWVALAKALFPTVRTTD